MNGGWKADSCSDQPYLSPLVALRNKSLWSTTTDTTLSEILIKENKDRVHYVTIKLKTCS